jgi:crotonobetainyl-CoA:carnitine CoA-transferase CaiB-like acyl-CoA transferase
VPIADLLAGMYGAYGVLAALQERQRTGRGQLVRTSLLAAVIGVHAFQGTRVTVAGELPLAQGNHHPSIAPYGLFRCADGAVQISVGSESLWQRFCATFDVDPLTDGLTNNGDRVRNRDQTIAFVESAFAEHEAADLLARLTAAGIPAGRVRTLREVYEWDQVASQGLTIDVDHRVLGSITLPGPPLRFFSGKAGETTPRIHTAPPTLDEHGPQIRAWLSGKAAS